MPSLPTQLAEITAASWLLPAHLSSSLLPVQAAMEHLAAAIPPDRIGKAAYKLYEQFRPEWKGWGVASNLSLRQIRDLAQTWHQHV